MAFNGNNGLGITKYMSSILFTGVAIMFWAIVNIIDTINPSPALDTVKVIAYLLIALSGLTIVIDVLLLRYKRK
jgi:hypothetical protein